MRLCSHLFDLDKRTRFPSPTSPLAFVRKSPNRVVSPTRHSTPLCGDEITGEEKEWHATVTKRSIRRPKNDSKRGHTYEKHMEIPLLSFFFSCFIFCGLGTMAFEPRKFIHCLLLLCISLMFIFIPMIIYQHVASVSSYRSPPESERKTGVLFSRKDKRFGSGI